MREPGGEAGLEQFDSVVMLTWSDWKTEPRSNRYHYASRFARSMPVLFVQPDTGEHLEEPTTIEGVSMVHVGPEYAADQLAPVAALLASRGLSRPLVWAYNPRYRDVDRHFPGALRAFHATEDYFSGSTFLDEPDGAQRFDHRRAALNIQRRIVEAVSASDMVVCVSEGVAEGIARHCAYRGSLKVLENGCDFAFWNAGANLPRGPRGRVAIYQGGINERLDATLLLEAMKLLPDWEFRFCGTVSPGFAGWEALQAAPNFRYLGRLGTEALRDALHGADVGLMPYRQVRALASRLMPLKAFEYAACGLPVVTVPIDSLGRFPGVFRAARTAAEFADAIVAEAATRDDIARRDARLAAARAQDYDQRFADLEECLRKLQPGHRAGAGAMARIAALAAREIWNRALFKAARAARL